MSEQKQNEANMTIAQYFSPEMVIDFATPSALSEFEDRLAPFIEPEYSEIQWDFRGRLTDEIKPKDVNTIREISFTAMNKPYERLLEAATAGKIPNVSAGGLTVTGSRTAIGKGVDPRRFAGFEIDAVAYKGGKQIGWVESAVWYFPTSVNRRQGHGDRLRRVVSKPELLGEDMSVINEVSQRIAHASIRKQLSNARPNPYRK
jgi:hypothetical protein